ncbi:PIG-L family deacetylase [Candidatus Pelagibacter sp.]|nr:PIG-L family deacetylase [Candidatus Pelagibacter sp.]
MKKILVLSPHPDDELLGCGGTLLKYSKAEISWIILTKMSLKQGFSKQRIKQREKEILEVKKKLNIKNLIKLNFETSTLNYFNLPKLISLLKKNVDKLKPDTIFAPHINDSHSDHFFCTYAINSIAKSFRYKELNQLFLYETLSETNFNFTKDKFIPNVYFDIEKTLEKKIHLLKIYKSEIKNHPFPRSKESVVALATLRGSESNFQFSEAFQLIFKKL